jgi:hypothetical protein
MKRLIFYFIFFFIFVLNVTLACDYYPTDCLELNQANKVYCLANNTIADSSDTNGIYVFRSSMFYEPSKGFVKFIDANDLKTHPNFYVLQTLNELQNFYESDGYANFINANGWRGEPNKYAEDQAYVAIAFIEGYRKTGDNNYLVYAKRAVDSLKKFHDDSYGGFYETIGKELGSGFTFKLSRVTLLTSWAFLEYYDVTKDKEYYTLTTKNLDLVKKYFYGDGRFFHSAYRNLTLTDCRLGGCCGNDTFSHEQAIGVLTFIRGYQILSDEEYKDIAIRALNKFDEFKTSNGFIRCTSSPGANKQALEQLIPVVALIKGYEFTNNQKYLNLAISQLEYISNRFLTEDGRIKFNELSDYKDLETQAYGLWAYSLATKYEDRYYNTTLTLLNSIISNHYYNNRFWKDENHFVMRSRDYALISIALSEYTKIKVPSGKENYIQYVEYAALLTTVLIVLLLIFKKFRRPSLVVSMFILMLVFTPNVVEACAGDWSNNYYGLTETILFPQLLNNNQTSQTNVLTFTTQNASWMSFENAFYDTGIASRVRDHYPYGPMYVPPGQAMCGNCVSANNCSIGFNPNPYNLSSTTYNTTFSNISIYLTNLRGCQSEIAPNNNYEFNSHNNSALCKNDYYDMVYFRVNPSYSAGYIAKPVSNTTSEAGFIRINTSIYKIKIDNVTNPSQINLTLDEFRLVNLNFTGSVTTDGYGVGIDLTVNNSYIEKIWTDNSGNYNGEVYANFTPGVYTLMVQGFRWCGSDPAWRKQQTQTFYVLHDPLQVYRLGGGNEVFNLSRGVNYTWLINITNYASNNWGMTLNLSILNTSNYLLKNETKPFFVLAGQNNITTFNFSASTEWPSKVKAIVKLEGLTNSTWAEYFNVTTLATAATNPFISDSSSLTFLGNVGVGETIYIYGNGYSPNGTTTGTMPFINKRSSNRLTIGSSSGKFNYTISWYEYFEKK